MSEENNGEGKSTFTKEELESITKDIKDAESKLKPKIDNSVDIEAIKRQVKEEALAEIKKQQDEERAKAIAIAEKQQQNDALKTIDDLKAKVNEMSESKAVINNNSPFNNQQSLDSITPEKYLEIDRASKEAALKFFKGRN